MYLPYASQTKPTATTGKKEGLQIDLLLQGGGGAGAGNAVS